MAKSKKISKSAVAGPVTEGKNSDKSQPRKVARQLEQTLDSSIEAILSKAPRRKVSSQLKVSLTSVASIGFDKATTLISRNNKSFDRKFYPLYEVVSHWNLRATFDGEIVVLGENGQSNFSKLQNWRSEADGDLVYYAFDILWYEGKDLMGLPSKQRQQVLAALLPTGGDRISLSNTFDVPGKDNAGSR